MTRSDVVPASSLGALLMLAIGAVSSGTVTVEQLALLLGSMGTPGALVLIAWVYKPVIERALADLCAHLTQPSKEAP